MQHFRCLVWMCWVPLFKGSHFITMPPEKYFSSCQGEGYRLLVWSCTACALDNVLFFFFKSQSHSPLTSYSSMAVFSLVEVSSDVTHDMVYYSERIATGIRGRGVFSTVANSQRQTGQQWDHEVLRPENADDSDKFICLFPGISIVFFFFPGRQKTRRRWWVTWWSICSARRATTRRSGLAPTKVKMS